MTAIVEFSVQRCEFGTQGGFHARFDILAAATGTSEYLVDPAHGQAGREIGGS